MSRIHNLKKLRIILESWKCISLGKFSAMFFFWKILKVGNLGRLVCAYCMLKDDMPFVSGSYMTEVNDYIEKSGLFSSKIYEKWVPRFQPGSN